MRLIRLAIKSPFKNLDGFEIDFSPEEDATIVIGRNGSAKSNLLESLIAIFTSIDLDAKSEFAYEIEYRIQNQVVSLSCKEDGKPTAKLGGKRLARKSLLETYVPRYVVAYYSGESDRFKRLFFRHDDKALDKTLEKSKSNLKDPTRLEFRRFIYARPEHGLFSLLAFYFSKDKVVQEFLQDLPRITGFDSVLLVAHKPHWAKKGPEDFWGAEGPVRVLLDRFLKHSLGAFVGSERVRIGVKQYETRELVYLYLPDSKALAAIAKEYDNEPQALFQALDTMRLSDLLESFRVRVNVLGADNAIHTRELSEGEQQLLTVLGLMRFTKNDHSLYLLDEPDTHLNPTWSTNYLLYLGNLAGLFENSHTLISTHDPLLVSGLRKEQIRVLSRNRAGQITAEQPEEDPRGTGVANVLTSELYGLESQLDPYSLGVLKEMYELSQQNKSKTRDERLAKLRAKVPALEILETSPDPYRNIAMQAYEMALDMALKSEEDNVKRSRIVEALAKRLYEEAEDEVE